MSEKEVQTKDALETIVEALKEEFPKLKFYLSRKQVTPAKDKPPVELFTLDVTEDIFLDDEETEEVEVLFKSITGEVKDASFAALKRNINAKIKVERPVTKKFSRTVNGRVLYGDYEQEKASVKSLGVRRVRL
jgi:hypothetical protein